MPQTPSSLQVCVVEFISELCSRMWGVSKSHPNPINYSVRHPGTGHLGRSPYRARVTADCSQPLIWCPNQSETSSSTAWRPRWHSGLRDFACGAGTGGMRRTGLCFWMSSRMPAAVTAWRWCTLCLCVCVYVYTVHRLIGLVVKASASRAKDPGFESRLRWDFFGVKSYQWLKNWHSSGYPARRLAL